MAAVGRGNPNLTALRLQAAAVMFGRNGQVAGRYEPTVTPEDLRPDLDALLAA